MSHSYFENTTTVNVATPPEQIFWSSIGQGGGYEFEVSLLIATVLALQHFSRVRSINAPHF
jgi:hypothetical protein